MMPSSDKSAYNDELLVQYLLGALAAEQTERLDALSISDDQFAWRLAEVENDLVDAYVRGKLEGETLRQFNSSYLASEKRRQKAEFAAALFEFEKRSAKTEEATARVVSRTGRAWRPWRVQWSFAVMALGIVLMAGYLFLDDLRLRRQLNAGSGDHSSSSQREQQLEKELAQQQSANVEARKELDRLRNRVEVPAKISTASIFLLPPTRGISVPPTLDVSAKADIVVVDLALESDEFSNYKIELKDTVTDRVIWQSDELEAWSGSGKKVVSAAFPAGLLKQQNYIAELSGVRKGAAEPLSGYPFRVVLR